MQHPLFIVRCSAGLYARKSIHTPRGAQLVTWVSDKNRASLFYKCELDRVRRRARSHGFTVARERAA